MNFIYHSALKFTGANLIGATQTAIDGIVEAEEKATLKLQRSQIQLPSQ